MKIEINQWADEIVKEAPPVPEWIEENLERFVFPVDRILGEAKEYSWYDRDGEGCGIYFLIYNNEIVYVGKGVDICQRLQRHWKTKPAWTHFWSFEGVPTEYLEQVEYFYIKWLNPALNAIERGRTEIADRLAEEMRNAAEH